MYYGIGGILVLAVMLLLWSGRPYPRGARLNDGAASLGARVRRTAVTPAGGVQRHARR